MADLKQEINQESYVQELVQFASLAEQAERYSDMVDAMKKVVESGTALTNEARNLLSVAYKNVIGSRRSSYRVVTIIEQRAANAANAEARLKIANEFRLQIEKEIRDICNEVLMLLDKYLVPSATEAVAKVFYLKMRGDYFRYLAEITSKEPAPGDNYAEISAKSQLAYEQAFDIAKEKMDATHPIRLGLALNYSVFLFEILQSAEKACEVGKQAFEDAVAIMDTLDEESYKDSTLIMQLLRDNLTLWTSDYTGDEPQEGEAAP